MPPPHDPPREEVKDTIDELMRSKLLPFPVVERLLRLLADICGLEEFGLARAAVPGIALALAAEAPVPGLRVSETRASLEGGRRQGERVAHK